MSAAAEPFSRPATLAIVGVVGVSLLCGWLGWLYGEPAEPAPSGAEGASSSAIGQRAFLELVRHAGLPVVVSRQPAAPNPGALLLLIEPAIGDDQGRARRLGDLLEAWPRALLVLPKWRGRDDPAHPGWIESARLIPSAELAPLLDAAGLAARIERPDDASLAWSEPFGFAPTLAQPQLVVSDALEPVIACARGILLGRVRAAPEHYVLADPDLLANHGLGQGDNAALALALVRRGVEPGAPVVVDETLHAGIVARNLGRELTRFPLVLVLLQAVLATAVFLWGGVKRYGPAEAPPAALRRSQHVLIDNTAQLLLLGGARGQVDVLERYLAQTLQDVGEARRLPASLTSAEREALLCRASEKRRLSDDPRTLREAARALAQGDAATLHVLRLARRIHSWREELLHGSRDGS